MLINQAELLRVSTSIQYRTFRTRFRVPFPVFEELYAWTKTWVKKSESKLNRKLSIFDAAGNSRAGNSRS